MVRFYCDYCKSYLTHDATSVRKNHLSGKNHVKLVCDYYEEEAKKLGIFHPNQLPFEIKRDNLYKGIPGSSSSAIDLDHLYKLAHTKTIPPPPTLQNFPQPPPKILHDTTTGRDLLGNILKTVN